jgi:predicted transcriptional regulator
VAYAERRIAAGARKCDIARELDVSQTTVAHWLSTAQPPRFEEVAIINDTSRSCGLVVVTPRGLRIEGLDLAAVVELVARHG